jgi:hypothetical protein
MSAIEQKGRLAQHELQITAEEHGKFRVKCLDEAVKLAIEGDKDKAYTKLLMVVALDGVHKAVFAHVESANIERGAAKSREPEPKPN